MGTGVHGVDTGRAPFPSSRSRPGDQRARPSGARFGLFYLLGVGKAGHPTYAVQHPTQRASGRRFGALVVRGAVPTGGRPRGHSSLTPLTASILSPHAVSASLSPEVLRQTPTGGGRVAFLSARPLISGHRTRSARPAASPQRPPARRPCSSSDGRYPGTRAEGHARGASVPLSAR